MSNSVGNVLSEDIRHIESALAVCTSQVMGEGYIDVLVCSMLYTLYSNCWIAHEVRMCVGLVQPMPKYDGFHVMADEVNSESGEG
jgi:hypothetical protein